MFALCDVGQKTHHPAAIDSLVLDRDFDVENAPILAPVPGLEAIPSPRQDGLQVGLCFRGAFAGLQLGDGLAQQFLLAVPAHPAVGSIDLQHLPLEVGQPETIQGGLDNGVAARLARAHQVCSLLALGDVHCQAINDEVAALLSNAGGPIE